MAPTSSEWKHETWNPVTGCSPVSEGCEHCYARGIALKLQGMGVLKYGEGFYFKQLDGEQHSSGGRSLDGRIWDEMPEPSGQLRLSGL